MPQMCSKLSNCFFLFLLFILSSSALKAQYLPGNSYFGTHNYIEYHAGNLPIIVAAPHGGTLEPSTIPDRVCGACVTVRDSWTEELAYKIDSAIQVVFGAYPHIIINKLSRKKLDANREIVEAALGNLEAETAWYEFHDYIQAAKDSAVEQYGAAIFIDLHAHGHSKQRIELGYLLSRSELLLSDSTLNALNFQDSSSIKHLKNIKNTSSLFSDLLRGTESMGELLNNIGFPSTPSLSDPSPLATDPFFSGGYNTARHGSRDSSIIDAIQFETNYTGIRNNNANRNAFARGIACVLRSYLDNWFFDLDSLDPGNVVTSTADSGPGSLRSVLLGASNNDTITFSNSIFGDTIQLSKELQICSDLVIIAPGAGLVTISGQNTSRILRVSRNVSVELSGVTFKYGKSPKGEDGGAVFVEGDLKLSRCILENNFAEDDGGAIVISDSSSSLQLDSCLIINNSCGDDGGAIRCWLGNLSMNACTVKDNYSPSYGGGISMNGRSIIVNSTFSNNSATTEGGAIRTFGAGELICTNSTFSGNISSYRGAGISSAGLLDLNFCTIVNNVASNRGGGIRLTAGGNCTLKNTIVANNSGSSGSDIYQFSASFTSLGHNLIADTTGSLINTAKFDQFGNSAGPIDPFILSLQANGGATETIALSANSPCIDMADSTLAPNTDQIGKPRIINGVPDIGAFEFQLINPIAEKFSIQEKQLIRVYPNPAKKQITIELTEAVDGELSISDVTGNVVHREKIESTKHKMIDISNYRPGSYYVQFSGDISAFTLLIVR